MRLLRFVYPRYAVFILRLWFLLSHYGEAMQSPDRRWTAAIQAVHDAANRCSHVTGGSPPEISQAAHLTCRQAFLSLDSLHVNICHGWRKAKCRPILGEKDYQCSVVVPPCVLAEAFGASSKILTVDTCAPELFNSDPTRRNPPPSLSRGASSSSSRDRGKGPLIQRQDTGGAGGWSSAYPFQPAGTGGWSNVNPFETGGTGGWSNVNPFETGGTGGWSNVNPFEIGGAGGWSSTDPPHPGGYYQPSGFSYPTRPSPPRSPTRATNPPPREYPSVRVPPSGATAPSAAREFPSALFPPSSGRNPSSGVGDVHQFTDFSFGDSLPGSPRRSPPPSPGLPVDPSFGVKDYGYRSDDELGHEGGTPNLPPPPASPLRPLGSRKKNQNIGNFKCPVCGKSYTYKKRLDNHMAAGHEKGGKYACPKCENPTFFPTRNKYKEHMESNHGEVFFECDVDNCGRTFAKAEQLRLHKDREHFGGTTCEICGAVFPIRRMMESHMKEHTGDGSRNAP